MKAPLLNFAGGPGVPLLNFGGSQVPLLNFEGGPGVLVPHLYHAHYAFSFAYGFLMFTSLCITFVFVWMLNVSF